MLLTAVAIMSNDEHAVSWWPAGAERLMAK
jgi:hypothetical protein